MRTRRTKVASSEAHGGLRNTRARRHPEQLHEPIVSQACYSSHENSGSFSSFLSNWGVNAASALQGHFSKPTSEEEAKMTNVNEPKQTNDGYLTNARQAILDSIGSSDAAIQLFMKDIWKSVRTSNVNSTLGNVEGNRFLPYLKEKVEQGRPQCVFEEAPLLQAEIKQLVEFKGVSFLDRLPVILALVSNLHKKLYDPEPKWEKEHVATELHKLGMTFVGSSRSVHPLQYMLIDTQGMMNLAKKDPSFRSLLYSNGDRYEGNVTRSHNRSGIGKMKYASNDEYIGDWQNDKRHGFGRYMVGQESGGGGSTISAPSTSSTPSIPVAKYVGYWSNDQRHGYGTSHHPDASIYTGQYENNKRHGFGIFSYPNGNQYVGYWTNGKRDKLGLFIFSTGDIYYGQFAADARTGFGQACYTNGSRYEGHWLNNLKHGKGVQDSYDSRFEGNFVHGERNGQGVFQFKHFPEERGPLDFTIYNGEWLTNQMHGPGRAVLRTGDKVEGVWEQGALVRTVNVEPSFTKLTMYNILKRGLLLDVRIVFST